MRKGEKTMFVAMIHGLLLSFGLILPLGPQNIFIFNQGTRARQVDDVLPAVLSAAICDTCLILLAVFSASLLALSHLWIQRILLATGCFFLLWIGFSIWHDAAAAQGKTAGCLSAKKQISFALSVSLLNPHALLDTIGVIGTSALRYAGNEKWAFATACISVSWFWFFILALFGHRIGKRSVGTRIIHWINKLSALIIWGIAGYMSWHLILSL
jgi:L-lysine exporter family protein LysE/ArgO